MTTYPSSPVDALTAETLALIAGDPLHARDRELIIRAVHAEADEHDGVIDPNRLRARLSNEHGLIVYHRCLGAVVKALVTAKIIRFHGYVETTGSPSGNNGRLARSYVMASSAKAVA